MKRFYKDVTVAPSDGDRRWSILLDGRPVRTPQKERLWVPTPALAHAVAEEWSAQGEAVGLETMPLTRVAAAAIDRIAPRRNAAIDDIAAIARSDLVCYRADKPQDLARRQEQMWQPLIDWVAQHYSVRLTVTEGVMPVAQSPEQLDALKRALADLSNHDLAALSLAASAAGSLVIALALAEGQINAETAFAGANLDESFQAERWAGSVRAIHGDTRYEDDRSDDQEAAARRTALAADLTLAARFFGLLRKP